MFNIFTHFGAKNLFSAVEAEEHGWRRRVQAQPYAQTAILAREIATGNLWNNVGDYLDLIEREGVDGAELKGSKAIDVYMANIFYATDGVTSHLFSRGTEALKGEEQSRRMASNSSETGDLVNTYFRLDYKDYLLLFEKVKTAALKVIDPKGQNKKSGPGRVRLGQTVLNGFYGGNEIKDWGFKRFIETKQEYVAGKFTAVNAPSSTRLAGNILEAEQGLEGKVKGADAGFVTGKTTDGKGEMKCAYLDQGAASECMDQIFAGMDTTGDTLSYLIYHLSLPRNRSLQESLHNELRALSLPKDHAQPLTQQQLNSIITAPYIDALVKETLRAFAAGDTALQRIVPRGGRVLDNYFLPEGTTIGGAPLIVNYSEEVFKMHDSNGQELSVTDWHPSRWLLASPEQHLEMDRRLWTFGSGGRGCIGKNLAVLEMKLLLAGLYSTYESLVDDKADLTIAHDHWTNRTTFRDVPWCKEAKGVIAFRAL
ncbi:putative cytochrome p450 [Phaeomoniella chlamydospora]|uniref:Putative cytochrome p450 n=1 Tax=Phaeomoniella chlamydospora TaxID=158046 RepID=A0A0G2HFL9_PHACM|nr:putative cytochrome p450 [Phaeomoniella chlamydospora]